MKFSALSLALLAAALANAAPTALEARQYSGICASFWAAPNNVYTQCFPADGQWRDIDNDPNSLSVTYITLLGGTTGSCEFIGIDGSSTTVSGSVTVPVGPPQVQKRGMCSY